MLQCMRPTNAPKDFAVTFDILHNLYLGLLHWIHHHIMRMYEDLRIGSAVIGYPVIGRG